MTFMLASVTGAEEAEIAVRHGADIIDLKDVNSAFGAIATSVIRATVDLLARRRPVSAVSRRTRDGSRGHRKSGGDDR